MSAFSPSELTLGELKRYRAFAFAPTLANPTHPIFLSIDFPERWVTGPGYQLFKEWCTQHPGLDVDEGAGLTHREIEKLSYAVLKGFRALVLPSNLVNHPAFSLEEPTTWMGPVALQALQSRRNGSTITEIVKKEEPASPKPLARWNGPQPDDDVISISSTEDDIEIPDPEPTGPRSRSSSVSSTSSVPASTVSKTSRRSLSVMSEEYTPSMYSRSTSPTDDTYYYRSRSSTHRSAPTPQSRSASVTSVSHRGKRPLSPSAGSSEETRAETSTTYDSKRRRVASAKSEKIKITKKFSVDSLLTVKSLPDVWTVPRGGPSTQAVLVDLTDLDDNALQKASGELRSIDAHIRAEDQESWGGSSGHEDGDAVVVAGVLAKEEVLTRRAVLKCNGINHCHLLGTDVFANCKRFEPDRDEMKKLAARIQEAKELEDSSPSLVLARFYARVISLKCKKEGCKGVAEIRPLKKPSPEGKNYFFGCSCWRRDEPYAHLYFPIPAHIDEHDIIYMMTTDGQLPPHCSIERNDCGLTVHPKYTPHQCPFTHVVDGKVTIGKMVSRDCPTRMIIYVPVDETIRKAIVELRHPHNHPMHPKHKPTADDRDAIGRAIQAMNTTQVTAQSLRNAPTTPLVLGGDIADTHPVFTDRRLLRKTVGHHRQKEFPQGTGWAGVEYEHNIVDMALSKEERYIQTVTTKGEIKIVVTMLPAIIRHIHRARYLVIDYTFKRVHGEINEWEIATFLEHAGMRVSLAILYCNHNTTEAFYQLFSEFDDAVRRVTNQAIQIAPFCGREGNIKGLLFDEEAAQIEGLGRWLLRINNPIVSGISTNNPSEAVQYVLKTCQVHYKRNIDKLAKGGVPDDVIRHLKRFPSLQNTEEIALWHNICRDIPNPAVQNWYRHKLQYPWLLPSLNPVLSRLPQDLWNLIPNDTNIAESAHAGRNAGTNHLHNQTILLAIKQAQKYDARVAKELARVDEGIAPKRWNTRWNREALSAQRQEWGRNQAHQRRIVSDRKKELEADEQRLKSEIDKSLQETSWMKSRINELRAGNTAGQDARAEIQDLQARIKDEHERRQQLRRQKKAVQDELVAGGGAPLTGDNEQRPPLPSDTPLTQDVSSEIVRGNANGFKDHVPSTLDESNSTPFESIHAYDGTHEPWAQTGADVTVTDYDGGFGVFTGTGIMITGSSQFGPSASSSSSLVQHDIQANPSPMAPNELSHATTPSSLSAIPGPYMEGSLLAELYAPMLPGEAAFDASSLENIPAYWNFSGQEF